MLPGISCRADDWGAAIIDAIQEAKALVLIFSSNSNDSDQIKREVERTVHQGIAVIPFRIEDVLPNKTLEYFISTQHWLDALTPPLEDHMAHLADTITVLLAKKGFKEESLHLGGEEPSPQKDRPPEASAPAAPPAPAVGAPARKLPLIRSICLAALLVGLGVAGGLWWLWSRPAVVATGFPGTWSTAPSAAAKPAGLSATDYYHQAIAAQDPEQQIALYTKAIDANPYNPQYHYYRGLAYKGRSRFPLALEDFNQAITYQPNYPGAYIARGETYFEMGRQDQAIADYTTALALDPKDAMTHLKRGHASLKKGDTEKALADYNAAISLKPDFARAIYSRGIIYHRIGENEKALNDYDETIRLDPKNVLAYRNRAALYERMGDKGRAAADWRKANVSRSPRRGDRLLTPAVGLRHHFLTAQAARPSEK